METPMERWVWFSWIVGVVVPLYGAWVAVVARRPPLFRTTT